MDITIRICLAMFIGGVIGRQRESINRPAGLRTHMLVSVGSAMVMIMGEYSFFKYYGMTNADPMRLGAQVISGIGFLGAGTIMKEGCNITGLTTAASLWTVACLGLAAGAGFYEGAIIGLTSIFIILTFFEQIQKRVTRGKGTRVFVRIKCSNSSQTLLNINRLAPQYFLEVKDVEIKDNEECQSNLIFKMHFTKSRNAINYTQLIAEIALIKGVQDIKMEEY